MTGSETSDLAVGQGRGLARQEIIDPEPQGQHFTSKSQTLFSSTGGHNDSMRSRAKVSDNAYVCLSVMIQAVLDIEGRFAVYAVLFAHSRYKRASRECMLGTTATATLAGWRQGWRYGGSCRCSCSCTLHEEEITSLLYSGWELDTRKSGGFLRVSSLPCICRPLCTAVQASSEGKDRETGFSSMHMVILVNDMKQMLQLSQSTTSKDLSRVVVDELTAQVFGASYRTRPGPEEGNAPRCEQYPYSPSSCILFLFSSSQERTGEFSCMKFNDSKMR
jgi:hypothetical protein